MLMEYVVVGGNGSKVIFQLDLVIIQDRIISHVKSTKFLGVIIDDKLKWNLHILYMKNKIVKSNGILYKIRNFWDRKTFSHLYNAFVFSYLIYGIEI